VTLADPRQEESKSIAVRVTIVLAKPDGIEKRSVHDPAQLDRAIDHLQIWKEEVGCHRKVKLKGGRAA
jgi:hypothetical protein